MSTDAPSRDQPVLDNPPQGPPDRVRPIARTVAVVAGLVAIVGALVLPFAPVDVSTPEVRWPVDPRDPAPTMLMLTAYEPVDLEARFSCRTARAATATSDGVVLSTMGPDSRDADSDALTVTARDGGVTIRSGGQALFAGALPDGDCRFVVSGDAAGMAVALDGTVVSTTASRMPDPIDPDELEEGEEEPLPDAEPEVEPLTPLPDVDVLRTSTPASPDATADDLSVRLSVDDAFNHVPSATKSALIVVIVLALVVGAVAMSVLALHARRPDRGDRERGPPGERIAAWARHHGRRHVQRLRAAPWRALPRLVDLVVPAVLIAWLFLAPITDDDGYYSAMAANVPFSGYVPNYYQLYNQGFTPFSWPYYALSWWQTTYGVGPVTLRVPSLVLGIATWFVARAYVARTPLPGSGRWTPALARLALAAGFLAWWLPYNMGVRPEPVVGFFTVAALVAVAEGLERRRLALLGLAVGLATAGLMAAPTGFIALAPLVAAAPATWRLIREGSATWWAAVGRWVVVLAPGAVGSLLGFSDGAYRDFVRSQAIFAPIQRAQTWYQELSRYESLLGTANQFGSYARRAAVLVCLLALVWFLVLLVATRARDIVVPARLPLAGWATLLAFVLLLPTPSKPTHHFGAFAGLGAVFLALLLIAGPRLVAALDRERRIPQAALVATGLSAVLVLALAGHGRDIWPYSWGLGQPAYGDYPSVRGLDFDQPLWWALGLVVVAGVLALVAHLRAPHLRRLALAGAVPVMVGVLLVGFTVWTVGDFIRAADRTSATWSPQVDAWRDPAGTRCGLAQQIDVLDPRGAEVLPTAVLPGGTPPPPLLTVDSPDAPPPEQRTEPFVPGAVYPDSLPSEEVPAGTPTWGSFLVPEEGATADARVGAFTTDWFRLPPAATDAGIAVAVSGRTGRDVSLEAEYGRETADGFTLLGTQSVATQEESTTWRTVPLIDDDAPPAGADVVRLVANDASTTTGGWLGFSAPLERRWTPLQQYLQPDGAVGVAWQLKSLFPCQRQPRQANGITEPGIAAIGYGATPEAALGDWTWDPERGGLMGHAERESDVTLLTTRVRAVGDDVDDVHVWDFREPYPSHAYELIRNRQTVSGLP
ncbi:arabinosyltransferase domain-containing protein [Actinomycetospora chibensis]|uniref:Arabinosyltransferase domain-containing protein n=1 Tax=Actinomycetospora chibensis TaxID=663606 RepID=A0ABV9RHF7_9PSEU|nr:arabinosyltransferase domain-containing protein [Actinomycetospora chibensis]MDD7922515.1 arabinosyltransferase domain-containing protein [Actinomycetospora chibensis]